MPGAVSSRCGSGGDGQVGVVVFELALGGDVADELMVGGVDLQLDFAGLGGEVVVEDGAVGRVLGGGLFGRQRGAGENVVVDADGAFGLIQEGGATFGVGCGLA
jgi:hypothetical protein